MKFYLSLMNITDMLVWLRHLIGFKNDSNSHGGDNMFVVG